MNDDFELLDVHMSPGSEYTLTASMKAASSPDSQVLKEFLANGNKIYNEHIQQDLQHRRENRIPIFPGSKAGDVHFPPTNLSREFGPNGNRVSSDPSWKPFAVDFQEVSGNCWMLGQIRMDFPDIFWKYTPASS